MNSVSIGLPGQLPAVTFRFGGLVFGDDRGLVIAPNDGFKGWWDGGAFRSERSTRPLGHGSFDAPGFMEARVVSISGAILARDPEDFEQLRTELMSVLNDGELGRIIVEYEGKTLWADCRLVSARASQNSQDESSGDFLIQIECPDPRKYGETRSFDGVTPAFHRGNAPAWPQFTVRGSTPGGYTITGPGGRRFVVTAALTSSQVHTIDMSTGILRINGAIVYGGTGRADLWSIPGGARVSHQISAGGSLVTTVVDTEV
ncbi:hypothetical protein D9V32_13445 [Mycetocola tolaasinivorans]|uniref:Siphovirus-type tail component RIFT-related domain-containing protein n=1 Tax=Mycetocola tolaasinivorans TaxID=76635 RepID=A0A3L7A2G8_9MICO|nr:phage tail domain-containing protein [Mycetocola tolaasinivorans]RLP74347.1 hypothetical protein D9V32_13445 [Mycetocola tolaasinivorans]